MFDDSVELDVGTAVLRLVNGLSLGSYGGYRYLLEGFWINIISVTWKSDLCSCSYSTASECISHG